MLDPEVFNTIENLLNTDLADIWDLSKDKIKQVNKDSKKKLNQLVKRSPHFQAFNRFQYKSPKGYAEYDNVILNLATELYKLQTPALDEILREPTERGRKITEIFGYTLRQASVNGLRPYWLAKPLASAFLATTPPKDWVIQTQELSGVIFLPCNVFSLPDNDFIEWIFFHLDPDFQLIYVSPRKNNNLLLARARESYTAKYAPLTSYDATEDNKLLESRRTSGWDTSKWKDLSPSDKIANITVQTLLYIENYEPNLNNRIPTEKKRKTTKYGDRLNLPCLVVGENYRVKTTNEHSTNSIPGSSKSTHWRSGYWKEQPYGKRNNPQYKTIWIEPVLVNAH